MAVSGKRTASNALAVRSANLLAVLACLRDGRAMSTPDLGEALQLHLSTVTRLMAVLRRAGLVEPERGANSSPAVGRPPTHWRMVRDAGYALGLALHPGRVSGVVTDLTGHRLSCEAATFDPHLRPRDLPHALTQFVDRLLRGLDRERVLGLGCAASGVVDPATGVLLLSGALLSDDDVPVVDFPLRDYLAELFPWPVHVANDANVGGLAVFKRLVRQGQIPPDGSLFYAMAVDDLWGFGCGLVVRGVPYAGAHGAAGEIIHPRLTLWRPPPEGLATQALAGDAESMRAIMGYLVPVIEHLAALAVSLDPDRIVLGGAFATVGDPFRSEFERVLRTTLPFDSFLTGISRAGVLMDPLWPDTVAVGAAETVLDGLFEPQANGEPTALVRMALEAG
ncbi:MAG TPA: ROK family transcriptional regulator [Armatimonadota bacterium]|nr:ROK family transcriptional regulator [Armatimonadota bacterium]